jgi:ribosomal protein S18 acetylase RimI-like enzyme
MIITITEFSIEEYDEVVSLWNLSEGVGLSGADSKENIQTFLNRNPGMSFVAYDNNVLVGAVLCGHDGRRGYIHHLAVHPDYQSQGIGRMLVDKCLVALKSIGIQKSHLFMFNNNQNGMKFWKRMGWTQRFNISVLSKPLKPID